MKISVGFFGLGLIGGSIAKAIHYYYGVDAKIYAVEKDEKSLMLALQEGIIDSLNENSFKQIAKCDYIFLCAPIQENSECIREIAPFISKDTILTDVGSVKKQTFSIIREFSLESSFIGGHPMTGSEKNTYMNSSKQLLENAYYIYSPTNFTSTSKIERFVILLETIKVLPIHMDEKEHDYCVGAISHVPHILSSILVNLVQKEDTPNELMKQIAAGGFKDITRISSSNPAMWSKICIENTEFICKLIETLEKDLQSVKVFLEDSSYERMFSFFSTAKDYRDSFLEHKGSTTTPNYRIYIDIPDETGILAKIATILATNNISIKNIGIVHNREFEEGALRIEFYSSDSKEEAISLLQSENYVCFL